MRPLREVTMGNYQASLHKRDAETAYLSVDEALQDYPVTLVEKLIHWAEVKPTETFIAKRDDASNEWRKVSYAETWETVQKLASYIVKRDLSAGKPIAILSGNGIEHAMVVLAAMTVGVPVAPISPQYSLVSTDYGKLKYVLELITPGLVFVDNGTLYSQAINASVGDDCEVVVVEKPIENRACTYYSDCINTPVADNLHSIQKNVKADDIAKFLFSSGSTGMPKAVVNTHKMLCANQQMLIQALPFVAEPPPVIVDWLPWNHTFGGNHNFGLVLYNGGTLYIDDGKPTPKDFKKSIANLEEISPTIYFNVPKGYEELVKALRADEALRKQFFSQLKMLFYAGAGISQPVWDALEELALETVGERILIVTGLGCTETAPSSLFTTGDGGFAGWLGLPVPGCEVKLVNMGGKTEIRFKGDHVTPGYWRQKEITDKVFDEEGFYCTGDAVKFNDNDDIQKGLVFDGRISEDFKLDTGTWVSAGPLRAEFLNEFGDCVKDVVIVGRDKPFVAALVFPNFESCRNLHDDLSELSDHQILEHGLVKEHFLTILNKFSEKATGSASRIKALCLLVDPPSLDKNEITDKGSLNASAIQDVRKSELESIYSGDKAKNLVHL